MHPNSQINSLLDTIYSPHLPSISPGLERITALLDALGNPQRRLPPVVHVAGTNGKGSVCANLSAIYSQAGMKVHRYTSPHLVTFNERIMLAGEVISDALLQNYLAQVVALVEQYPVTFFEATTAAAFLAFSDIPADLCILEVGLGGRLDATNVVDKPLLTVITPVDMDHKDYLGHSIEAIASEKAGILKHGVPCVLSHQQPEAMSVIEARAKELKTELIRYGDGWKVEDHTYQSPRKVIVFDSSLVGDHQLHNAGISLACVETLNNLKEWDVSPNEASKALTSVVWPGRLQKLNGKISGNVWLDGAHNMLGARALKQWLEKQEAPRTLAIGMLDNRDAEEFISLLAPLCERVIGISDFTEAPSHSHETLEAVCQKLGLEYLRAKNTAQLLKLAQQQAGLTIITGSLYLAGAVLAETGAS